jgi:hypothetical protein
MLIVPPFIGAEVALSGVPRVVGAGSGPGPGAGAGMQVQGWCSGIPHYRIPYEGCLCFNSGRIYTENPVQKSLSPPVVPLCCIRQSNISVFSFLPKTTSVFLSNHAGAGSGAGAPQTVSPGN